MISLNLGAYIAPSKLEQNKLIFVTVKGLVATDGSALSEPISVYFSTKMTPLYSNVMRVRLKAGEFLGDVPDITILQMVRHYSDEADLLNFREDVSAANSIYANYRARWVTLSTVLTLLTGTAVNSDMQKRLGDLSIRRVRAAEEILNEIRRQLRDLTSTLEDGGNYGRDAEAAVKGLAHPDRPGLGRTWASPDRFSTGGVPAANSRDTFVRSSDGLPESKTRRNFQPKKPGER